MLGGIDMIYGHESAAYIGDISLGDNLNCKIAVYGDEGDVPHFHIKNDDSSFECCVCIYEPKYYDHGDRENRQLSYSQKEELNKWMHQMNKYFKQDSNWEMIDMFWENCENNMKYVPEHSICPNYLDL